MNAIKVISCGLNRNSLTSTHIDLVNSADIIAGGERLLEMFPNFLGEKISLDGSIVATLKTLFEKQKSKRIVVLASGDSLFYGVGALVAKLTDLKNVEFIPNVSSMQYGASLLGIKWSNLKFYSVHGRDKKLPLYKIVNEKFVAILCDNRKTPTTIADDLIRYDKNLKERIVAVAENLGQRDERVIECKMRELKNYNFATLSILFLLNKNITRKPLTLGVSDSFYEKDNNCITHPEVRAIAIAKLKLKPNSVLWDLGAGSGSVGIEASTMVKSLEVYSVEKDSTRCKNIESNILRLGVNSVTVVHGDILNELNMLPNPEAVFIGGGGVDILDIIDQSLKKICNGGVVVVTAIMEETINIITTKFRDNIIQNLDLQLRREKKVGKGNMMSSDNPVRIFCLEKTNEQNR